MTASSQLNDRAEKSVEQRAIVRTRFDRLPGRAVNAHCRQLRGWLLRLKLESCHTVVPNETLLDMRVIRNERTVDLMVPFSKLPTTNVRMAKTSLSLQSGRTERK